MRLEQLLLEHLSRQANARGVGHQVIAQLVSLRDHAADEPLVARDPLADDEEGGARMVLGQYGEDSWGERGVRGVVDGERDTRLLRLRVEEDIGVASGEPPDDGARTGKCRGQQDDETKGERRFHAHEGRGLIPLTSVIAAVPTPSLAQPVPLRSKKRRQPRWSSSGRPPMMLGPRV